jgi:hypothetical protein
MPNLCIKCIFTLVSSSSGLASLQLLHVPATYRQIALILLHALLEPGDLWRTGSLASLRLRIGCLIIPIQVLGHALAVGIRINLLLLFGRGATAKHAGYRVAER